MNNFDKLCDYMLSLKSSYNNQIYGSKTLSEDDYVRLRSKVTMLEQLLVEAASIRNTNKIDPLNDEDYYSGC